MKGPEDALCDRLTFIACKRELPSVDCVKACAHHCLTRGYVLQEGVRMSGKKGRCRRRGRRERPVPSTNTTVSGVRQPATADGPTDQFPRDGTSAETPAAAKGQAGRQWSVSPPDASSHALPHELFVYYDIRVGGIGINVSARRHGVVADDIRHAITHAVHSDDIDPEPPVRRLHLGPDRSGNMLEVVTLHFDDGGVLAIHAMKMTKQYWRLLKGHRND